MAKAVAVRLKAVEPRFIPWEDRSEKAQGRFIRSWLMLVTRPGEFYRRMALRGGMGEPLGFQVICAGLAFAVTVVQFLVLYLILHPGKPDHWPISWFPGSSSASAFIFNIACVFALLTPLFALACALGCLLLGIVARLAGGAGPRGAGVESHFSVFAYATGPLLLAVVPVMGWAVGLVWWLFLSYKGMRSAIGFGVGGSLRAIVAPLVLYGILVWIGILIF